MRRFVARIALFFDGVAADLRRSEEARLQGLPPEGNCREFSQGEASAGPGASRPLRPALSRAALKTNRIKVETDGESLHRPPPAQLLKLVDAHLYFQENARALDDVDEEWLEFGHGADPGRTPLPTSPGHAADTPTAPIAG